MNMIMNANFFDHSYGTSYTTNIKLAACDPNINSYKMKMTEKMFDRWIKPEVSPDELSWKSVRAISFLNTLYRITIEKKKFKDPYCKVEKMTPTNGWVTVLTEDDLIFPDFKEFTDSMSLIFSNNKDKSVTTTIPELQKGYDWMDDIDNDFINSIILLFND